MQTIKQEEIDDLLTIIPRNYPILDIFHLTSSCQGLCASLYNLSQQMGYNYDLLIPNLDYCQYINQTTPYASEHFDFHKKRYNRQARVYDFIFIHLPLKEIEEEPLFFKKLYPVSKNAGKVFFIIEQDENISELEEKLIAHNYVATNPIENTFENYQILGAQKMHGWGNK